MRRTAQGLVSALSVIAVNASLAAVYSVINVGTLPGNETSYGMAINDNGEVAGYSFGPGGHRAFIYRNGSIQPVPAPIPDVFASAYAINNAGQVAGAYRAPGDIARAFLFDGVNSIDLGDLQLGRETVAWGMNDHGQVVGCSWHSAGGQVAVIYRNGQLTQIVPGSPPFQGTAHDINNFGQIAGVAPVGPGGTTLAGYYESGSFTAIGSLGGRSEAYAINDQGFIAGVSYLAPNADPNDPATQLHAYFWDGGMHDIGVLGGTTSWAMALNNLNQVVGWSTPASSLSSDATHAFIWDAISGLRNLNDLIPADSGWTLTSAYGINDKGWITGVGTLAGVGERPFLMIPIAQPPGLVPEPTSLALLGLGLAGLAALRRPRTAQLASDGLRP